tara:strand:+ start:43 stop:354 length:312 start_codon:yes stop_codon:yes gene_type:complete
MRRLKFTYKDETQVIDTLTDHQIFFEGQTFDNVYATSCIFTFEVDSVLDPALEKLVDILADRNSNSDVFFELLDEFDGVSFLAIPYFYRTKDFRTCEVEVQFR